MGGNKDVVRVKLRYPDLETFVERFAPNVTRGGIFLASREPRPVGAVLRFELYIKAGGAVLSGEGRVTWFKDYNPEEPHKPYGMGVQFIYVDPPTRPVLDRLLQRREANSRPTPVVTHEITAQGQGEDTRPTQPQQMVVDDDDTLDEATYRRAVERARAMAARNEELAELLTVEPEERSSLADVLADLPRVLTGRRGT